MTMKMKMAIMEEFGIWITIFDKAVPSPEANCEDLLKGCHCDNVTALGGECWPLAEIEKRGPLGKQPTVLSQMMPLP